MKANITIGMDLGDKLHIAVVFYSDSTELDISKVSNTKAGSVKILRDIKELQ